MDAEILPGLELERKTWTRECSGDDWCKLPGLWEELRRSPGYYFITVGGLAAG